MASRDVLVEIASLQHGYVTVDDADVEGIGSHILRQLAVRGHATQVSRGIYRMNVIAPTMNDDLHLAVLLSGRTGVIGGESALALHDLADVNPTKIRVAVPPGFRTTRRPVTGPPIVFERWAFSTEDLDEVDRIPVAGAAMAIRMSIAEAIDPSLVDQAILNAERRQLIGRRTAAHLVVEMDTVSGNGHR